MTASGHCGSGQGVGARQDGRGQDGQRRAHRLPSASIPSKSRAAIRRSSRCLVRARLWMSLVSMVTGRSRAPGRQVPSGSVRHSRASALLAATTAMSVTATAEGSSLRAASRLDLGPFGQQPVEERLDGMRGGRAFDGVVIAPGRVPLMSIGRRLRSTPPPMSAACQAGARYGAGRIRSVARLRVALCQLDTVVGDIDGNCDAHHRSPGPSGRGWRRSGRIPRTGHHGLSPRGPAAQAGIRGGQPGGVSNAWRRPLRTASRWSGSSISPRATEPPTRRRGNGAGAVAREAAMAGPPACCATRWRCVPKERSSACTTSELFPTTASSTKSGGSRPGRRHFTSMRSPARSSACRCARTPGFADGPVGGPGESGSVGRGEHQCVAVLDGPHGRPRGGHARPRGRSRQRDWCT